MNSQSEEIKRNSNLTHHNRDDEIEEDLTCSICLDLLYQPVTTNCGHTFCKECLNE